MKLTLPLIAGVAVLAAANASAVQVAYNGHLYELTNGNPSWTGAEQQAINAGGHLVAINDAAEETFLRNTFGLTENFWIGFNDADTEGTWVWSNGDAVTYTNWSSGEPNNAGNEDYAVLNWNDATGGWNDLPNGSANVGIIEIAQNNNDVPDGGSTALLLGSAVIGFGAVRRSLRR